jgi:hypothetical protein
MLPEEHVHLAMKHLHEAREHNGLRGLEEQQLEVAEAVAGETLALLTDRREGLDDCEVLTDDGGEQA